MNVRPLTADDLADLAEIDATIESRDYLHVDRTGEGLEATWRLERRPLREKLIEPNRPGDDLDFTYRQVARGIEEGPAVVLELEGRAVAVILLRQRPDVGTVEIADLRVDYDHRREGFAQALLFTAIQGARGTARAMFAEVAANNTPALDLLTKVGFELAGLDERRHTNFDLVKESATLRLYLSLE